MLRRVGRVLTVVALVLVVANLAVVGLSYAARASLDDTAPAADGVDNLRVVDARVLRGDAPTHTGYRNLAALGVTTIVDLRAEHDLDVPTALLASLGIDWVHHPVRDGQTPTADQVEAFIDTVAGSPGRVYLHCGAGVGRTGAMAAAYLVGTGQSSAAGALRRNLAVGPPSLEQIHYAATLDAGEYEQPPALVKAVSRFLDAPRRIWSRVGL
jgi:protein-tyrosine phosphatase